MKLFSGTSNLPLAEKICGVLNLPMNEVNLKRFADGESFAEFIDSARSQNAVLVQSISNPVNDNLMEALLMVDALKRNGAEKITLVAPYLGYSRQDRRANALRTPISAKLVADILQVAGVHQLITADVHNLAIEGFYNISFMNVSPAQLFADDVRTRCGLDSTIIVSPDAGGVGRARQVAKRLDLDVAVIDKRREKANQIESMRLIGDVTDKDAILVDDIADTCNTTLQSVELLHERGAKSVRVYVSHGIFSGDALKRISETKPLVEVVVTDSIKNDEVDKISKIRRLSIAPELAEVIRRAVEN